MYLLEVSLSASPKFGQEEGVSCMDEVEMEVTMVSLWEVVGAWQSSLDDIQPWDANFPGCSLQHAESKIMADT